MIDATWNTAGFFEFLLDAEQSAEGNEGNTLGFARSTGSVVFIPKTDSMLTIDIEYNYDLGNGDRAAEARLNIGGGPAPGSQLFFTTRYARPLAGSPSEGTLTIHASVPLLAHEIYGFSYGLELESFSGTPTNLSTADGFLKAHVVPIPEPATMAMLLLVTPALRRRRLAPSR